MYNYNKRFVANCFTSYLEIFLRTIDGILFDFRIAENIAA